MAIEIKQEIIRWLNRLGQQERCYSQGGEDLVLHRLFNQQEHGFFVDIGANHPVKYSNTYLLYLNGWHGINIDAMPGAMVAFEKIRPRDINVEVGIASENTFRKYFIFHSSLLNTFDPALAQQRITAGEKLEREIKLPLRTINSVLEEFLPSETVIDLLTIDIEGLDASVLYSFDFSKYQPRAIVCEMLNHDIEKVLNSELAVFLLQKHYHLFSKLYHSYIWRIQDK